MAKIKDNSQVRIYLMRRGSIKLQSLAKNRLHLSKIQTLIKVGLLRKTSFLELKLSSARTERFLFPTAKTFVEASICLANQSVMPT